MIRAAAASAVALAALLPGCASRGDAPPARALLAAVPEGGGAEEAPPRRGRHGESLEPGPGTIRGDFDWSAALGYWRPEFRGEGWRRGISAGSGVTADGVEDVGGGGGLRLGVRYFPEESAASGGEPRAPADGGGLRSRHSFGIEFETFAAGAEATGPDGGGEGSVAGTDLYVDYGCSLVTAETGRTILRPGLLVGVRVASLSMDEGDLDAIDADENRSSGQALLGANLEFAPVDGVTLFGRVDGGFRGRRYHHEEKSSSLHWFVGLRARLAEHVSLEAGWRYYRVRVNRESSVNEFRGNPPEEVEIIYESRRNELIAQGPWLGIAFDF